MYMALTALLLPFSIVMEAAFTAVKLRVVVLKSPEVVAGIVPITDPLTSTFLASELPVSVTATLVIVPNVLVTVMSPLTAKKVASFPSNMFVPSPERTLSVFETPLLQT